MKKQYLILLIVLMSISLIGIISIQLIWIRNAIAVKQEQFDQDVYQAMNRTVYQLERNETVNMLNWSFNNSYYSSPILTDTFKNEQFLIEDTANNIIIAYDKSSNDSSYYRENISIDFQFNSNGKSSITTSILKDTVIDNKRYAWILNGNDTNLIYIKPDQGKIIQKSNQINQVLDQMMNEFNRFDNSIDKRLERGKFLEVLEAELTNQGINSQFEYAVLNNSFYQTIPVKSEDFSKENFDTKYKVRLYPSDIFANDNILFLHFPKKSGFIIKSISLLLTFSIILTLIIISTFSITIYIILKQKKLSIIKSDFINNMTHEFKTPIATISLAADSISNDRIISDEEKVKHFTNIIKEENKRMNTQVENVLQMSLIDKEDFQFMIQEVDIHSLIQRAVSNISLQVEKKNGTIATALNATNPIIESDETHFMHIIYNLLDNANKYSPDSPEIMVTTESNDEGIYIEVSDHGIGMSKEQSSKIFEKFYRVSKGNIHDVKGFGLGLSYVKALVLAFKGQIEVKSELGKGSAFQLFLPYKTELK